MQLKKKHPEKEMSMKMNNSFKLKVNKCLTLCRDCVLQAPNRSSLTSQHLIILASPEQARAGDVDDAPGEGLHEVFSPLPKKVLERCVAGSCHVPRKTANAEFWGRESVSFFDPERGLGRCRTIMIYVGQSLRRVRKRDRYYKN